MASGPPVSSGERARPAVSVIVPFAGERSEGVRALAALGRLRLRDADELIVADNSSTGCLSDLPSSAATVIAAPAERSSYYARNVAAEAASAEWLLFLDADVRPPASLLDDYLSDPPAPGVGILAGGVVAAPEQTSVVARYARSRGHLDERFHIEGKPLPAGITANLLVRRQAWESVGGFQEGIRSGGDVELCWRVQEAGWSLQYRPGARVEHLHPDRLAPLLRKTSRHAAGRLWVRRRYPEAYESPRLARALVRATGGALVWSLRGEPERAVFKLIDGAWACADSYGYRLGDNRAPALSAAPPPTGTPQRRLAMFTDAFPARSETFVHNEAFALAELGWSVRVEASARPARVERAVARRLRPTYLEDDPIPQKARDLAWLLARHPIGCARDLAESRRWRREEPARRLSSLAPAARRLARHHDAHVHVHFAAGAALHALRLNRLLGTPWSVNAHAYDVFLQPRNLRAKLERSNFAVAPCRYTADHLRSLVRPPHRPRIHEIVMGVDPERFRRRGPTPAGRTVVAIGRLVEKKGFEYLIEAAALLRERAPVRVVLVGDGPLREPIGARIEALGLDEDVELRDAWGTEAIASVLEQADLLAMPSVIAADGDRDAMPVVVKEALAMEVPVVASDEVGLPELVRPQWGRLVAPRDPAGLAAAIEELLALPAEQRREMGRAGRAHVVEHCSLAGETRRLSRLIESASG